MMNLQDTKIDKRTNMTLSTYSSILRQYDVTIKEPFMNRKAIPRATTHSHYQSIVTPLNLPTDYLAFLCEIGPGTLGNCRIYGLTEPISQFDYRFHSHRLNKERVGAFTEMSQQLNQPGIKVDEYIFFANDMRQEELWFAYKLSRPFENDESEQQQIMDKDKIYVIDMDYEGVTDFTPKIICKNGFQQFVTDVCLGNRIQEKDITSMKTQRDEEEQEQEQEERKYTFMPFSCP
jgi:hypothetical protein